MRADVLVAARSDDRAYGLIRRNWRRIGAVMALTALFAVPTIRRPARGAAPIALGTLPADSRLSVMTYNVEGLPFPVRVGRGASLQAIGERLRELRDAGRQPHIVALQEAFSDDARAIGALGGYRYSADGPSSDLAGEAAATDADSAFAAAGRSIKGERAGKLVDSGLRILSDYPIVAVRRMAFPDYACAGYDCLANKGVVMATIRVPGMPHPVAVVDTHLNSRFSSGVDSQRSLYAYRRQVDAIGRFLQANRSAAVPLIVVGDFNVGKDRGRIAYLKAAYPRWWNGAGTVGIRDALHSCAEEAGPCAASLSADARFSLRRQKDWQIAAPGAAFSVAPRQIETPFGHEPDGSMLSDHVGYTVYYGLHAAGSGGGRS